MVYQSFKGFKTELCGSFFMVLLAPLAVLTITIPIINASPSGHAIESRSSHYKHETKIPATNKLVNDVGSNEDMESIVFRDETKPSVSNEDANLTATDENKSEVCLTRSCIHSSSEILSSLNTDVDPCNDFYEFACGGWARKHPKSKYKCNKNHFFAMVERHNLLLLKDILEKASNFSGAEKKVKVYYDACVETKSSENSTAMLLEIVNAIVGFTNLSNINTVFSMQQILQKAQHIYDISALFSWTLEKDNNFVNSKHNNIHLQPFLGGNLITEQYLNQTANKDAIKKHLKSMGDICATFTPHISCTKTQMKRVLKFQTKLTKIVTPPDNDGEFNRFISVHELQAVAPFLNWLSFFNNAFRAVNKSITEEQRVILSDVDYFRKLSHLLKQYTKNKSGQNTIKSYMAWATVTNLRPYISAEGIREADNCKSEPWRFCVVDVASKFSPVVRAMFLRDRANVKMQTHNKNIMNNIRTAFKNNLKNIHWMDAEARAAAEDKADGITPIFGFPSNSTTPAELSDLYSEMTVLPNQYLRNNLEVILFHLKWKFAHIDMPLEKRVFSYPLPLNAMYDRSKNSLYVLPGLYQRPMYDEDNAESVNYGRIGVVMGHEFSHAFDNQGVHYDRNGYINALYNELTNKLFKKETECIRKQYSNFTLKGIQLNGTNTLPDDIADNGGVKLAYQAYLDESSRAAKIYHLPGLPYSHRQTFFIAYAQFWCDDLTKKEIESAIKNNDHSVGKYRVIGPLINLNEFSREFKCPLGSKMNPKDKCLLF